MIRLTPGLAPYSELGPWLCYQTIARAKMNNVRLRHFFASGHRLGARAPKLSFWPIFFGGNKRSPVTQPIHYVRNSPACNTSLSLTIIVKFLHTVQIHISFLLT